ncbi:YfhO family protein [Dolosigranulum pigrum]|uniref:YfhO family protein n=1 Tax=Dolosigranulum pigrum TaxID=29394 RepID=UPI00242EDDAD|nr:YfhO family protein [Dolosigranulum pigrum]
MKLTKRISCTCLLSTIILMTIFFLHNITPFGDQTLFAVDMNHQYIDFFKYYKYVIEQAPEQILYSFQKGIGGEMIQLWAYYLMSPFNLIFLLFKEEQFPAAVTFLTSLKLIMATATMHLYIHKRSHLDLIQEITLSLAYGLMSYIVVYHANIMWLDGVIFLPLIVCYLEILLRTNRGGQLYALFLGITIISNYYIGFMISLFLALYAGYYLIVNINHSLFENIKQYGKFIAYSILGASLSAVIMLPNIELLRQGKVADASLQWGNFISYTPIDILSKQFIGAFQYNDLINSPPHTYVGIFATVLVLLYLINKNISFQKKIGALGMLSILYLSTMFDILNQIWHGGQFPVWFPHRFSFIISFFILLIAVESLEHSTQINLVTYGILTTLVTLICLYYSQLAYGFLSNKKIIATWLIYIIVLTIWLEKYRLKKWSYRLLLLVTILDLGLNQWLIMNNHGYTVASEYIAYSKKLQEITTQLDQNDNFYRVSFDSHRRFNDAMNGHYNGLSHYSSNTERQSMALFNYLGIPTYHYVLDYSHGTWLTDALFNIKYSVSVNEDRQDISILNHISTRFDQKQYKLLADTDEYSIRENSNRINLGTVVNDQVLLNKFIENNPISNQEMMYQLLSQTDNKLFSSSHLVFNDSYNVTKKQNYWQINDSEKEAWIEYRYHIDNSQNPAYLMLPQHLTSELVNIAINDTTIQYAERFNANQVISIPNTSPAEENIIRINLKQDNIMLGELSIHELNKELFTETLSNQKMFQEEIFMHSYIKGKIEATEDGSYMLTSIPYDKNWQLKIDGKKVDTVKLLDTLLGIPLKVGQQTIELTYRPTSLLIGAVVSVVALISIIFGLVYQRKEGEYDE